MRTLSQPGPAPSERIEAALGHGRVLDYELAPGLTLIDALMRPVVAGGLRGGMAMFRGAVLSPFRYVMPGPPRDDRHVAWFSEPRAAPGSCIETANATLGWRDGAPFVHCHAIWTEPDGSRRGGHILPDESVVLRTGPVRAWAVEDVSMAVGADTETGFSLFRPESAGGSGRGDAFILARIRPNQEIGEALSAICRRFGISRAHVRGSVGSLIGPVFADGRELPDHATEVLVRSAEVRQEATKIEIAAVDMLGIVHDGRLRPHANAVCITFEAMLEPA